MKKITQVGRKINIQKKSEKEVCLLFWLEICSIIGAYFIPILVLKFELKISVKTSVKTRGFLSPFFLFVLLYSRAILSFSMSLGLLLCVFIALIVESSSKICLVKTLLVELSFHFFGLWLLLVSLFPCL